MPPRKKRTTLTLRFSEDAKIEAGVDEAGRGCFWGPLVAGAVVWPQEADWTEEHKSLAPQIQDSKLISKKRREVLATSIKKLALSYGIGIVEAKEIDEMGMTYANQEAFRRALKCVVYDRALIDGILSIEMGAKDVETIVDGDAKYLPIAAASILAKVAHDEIVTKWCAENVVQGERYNLMSCMGYGTLRHRDAIKEHGLIEHHRRLFMKNTLPSSMQSSKTECLIQDY